MRGRSSNLIGEIMNPFNGIVGMLLALIVASVLLGAIVVVAGYLIMKGL